MYGYTYGYVVFQKTQSQYFDASVSSQSSAPKASEPVCFLKTESDWSASS